MAFPQPGVTAEQSADRLEGGGAARFRQALAPEPDQFRRELGNARRQLEALGYEVVITLREDAA